MSLTCMHTIAEARRHPHCQGCNAIPDREVRQAQEVEAVRPSTDLVFSYLQESRDFRREYLGEFVDHLPRLPHYTHEIMLRDEAAAESRRRPSDRPARPAGCFLLVSPTLAGELEPDAVVLFDRDLEAKIAEPVFVARWGQLYVGSLANHRVCWCWEGHTLDEGGPNWDDISDGIWHGSYGRQWEDCLDRARRLRGAPP